MDKQLTKLQDEQITKYVEPANLDKYEKDVKDIEKFVKEHQITYEDIQSDDFWKRFNTFDENKDFPEVSDGIVFGKKGLKKWTQYSDTRIWGDGKPYDKPDKLHQIYNYFKSSEELKNRHTGKTTRAVNRIVDEAFKHPGNPIEISENIFVDYDRNQYLDLVHHVANRMKNEFCNIPYTIEHHLGEVYLTIDPSFDIWKRKKYADIYNNTLHRLEQYHKLTVAKMYSRDSYSEKHLNDEISKI